ncbi:hypothetical protein C8J57DRAFT_1521738 [Mycena rebaudengoi]|nr:hypothetical protein C8J57DRAFT_1521738 [Mycena rebaudengoi]
MTQMAPEHAPPGAQLVPKLARILFSQDIFNEDDFIRPIYDKDMEYEVEITPPSSPLARYSTSLTRSPGHISSDNSSDDIGLESSPTTLVDSSSDSVDVIAPISPRGLIRYRHWTLDMDTEHAMEEIYCEYNAIHKMYLQYIQFSLGGVPSPEEAGSISPRAVFRTWYEAASGDQPYWVKYHLNNSYALRSVSANFAAGRVALLACSPDNLCIWAQQVNPAALSLPDAQRKYLSDVAPEDSPYPPIASPA